MSADTSREKKLCALCASDQGINKRCGRCRSVWYCSAEHQKAHWKSHKKDCTNKAEPTGDRDKDKAEPRTKTVEPTTNHMSHKSSLSPETPLFAVAGASEAGVNYELPEKLRLAAAADIPSLGAEPVIPVETDSKTAGSTVDSASDSKLTPEQQALLDKMVAEQRKAPAETLVECPHQAALGTDEPCVECQAKAYELAKTQFQGLKASLGLSHEKTLDAALQFFSQLIAQYKLTECDDLLSSCLPVVQARAKEHREDRYYIQVIQGLAFLRFKQFRFADAVRLFEEMKTLLPPSERLLENLGHAYNSLGNYPKAEESLGEALKMINASSPAQQAMSNKGGVLLGLGLVMHHQNRTAEGLPILLNALNWYIERHPGDHSLQAKAHSSVGDAYQTLQNLEKADYHLREAVRIFRVTCGDDSPLTAKALAKHGHLLVERGQIEEARAVLSESLESSVNVDLYSVHLTTIVQLLLTLGNLTNGAVDKEAMFSLSAKCAPLCTIAYEKLKKRGALADDGDTAVFYKVYAEHLMLCGQFKEARPIIYESCRILEILPGPEAASLLSTCEILKSVADQRVRPAAQPASALPKAGSSSSAK